MEAKIVDRRGANRSLPLEKPLPLSNSVSNERLTSLNKSLTRDILLLTSLFAVRNLALVLGNSGDEAVAIRSMALQNQHMTIGVIANPCLLSQSLTAKPMTQVSELVKERWPSMSEIELAKQKAQEIAARLLNNVDPMKRARVENGAGGGYT
ncbi:uncharacterized protein [Henckelia pumila]|uniref:uncharacterized protein isoform X2 n=1 Tax=Henckelia pumila TaxID=405737 RepID=UPI003C6E8907